MASQGNHGHPPELGQTIHQYLNQFIGYADAKLAAVIAGSLLVVVTILQVHTASREPSLFIEWLAVGVFSLSSIVGAGGFFPHIEVKARSDFVGKAVSRFPFVPSLVFRSKNQDTTVIFWEGILRYRTPEQYTKAVEAITAREVEQQFAFENFQISRVLHKKYVALQVAVTLFTCGLILTVISLLTSI
jgi:hypothetical protein